MNALRSVWHGLAWAVLVIMALGLYSRVLAVGPPTPKPPLPPPPLSAPQAFETASPSVVHVRTEGTAWWYFFGMVPFGAEGSGAILSARGEILTNAHVIEDAQRVFVTLADGSRYRARIRGQDASHDIALLDISRALGSKRVKPFALRDSATVRVGETVYAIGSPFGLRQSLSAGVVSSVYRRLAEEADDDASLANLIQTDVAVNPGNSGGALMDAWGRLIGINTSIYTLSGGSDGVSFAIPINVARRIAEDFRAYGRLKPPFLGVQLAGELTPSLARRLKLNVSQGLLIKRVQAGSPAAEVGLRGGRYPVNTGERRILAGGDVIVALNGQPVASAARFIEAIEALRPGDNIVLTTLRNGQRLQSRIRLGQKPTGDDDD